MKKTAVFIFTAVVITGLCVGCKNKSERPNTDDEWLPLQNGIENNTGINSSSANNDFLFPIFGDVEDDVNPLTRFVENLPPPAIKVDVDFTTFSRNKFDEELSNIMFLNPENFLDKTVRIVGQYSGVFDEFTGRYKHYVIVDDAGGCCVRFMEFEWIDGKTPNTFPPKFSIIDVAGLFKTYHDDSIDWDFYYLEVNGITVLKRA